MAELIGVDNAEDVLGDLHSFLVYRLVPEAPVTIYVEEVEGKKVILVKVQSGSKTPYVFQGSIYLRRNSITNTASPSEINSLIKSRQQAEVHWERQAVLGASIFDLDFQEIEATIKQINKTGRGKEQTDVDSFLMNYGLYQNGNITNAGIVLFAKEPAKYIPQVRVRLVVFLSGKTDAEYINDLVLEGNIFKNVLAIQDFFKTNLRLSTRFEKDQWVRKDVSMYPFEALREGVMNALIHRDYSNVRGSVSINIYADRLEIMNFGSLPEELKAADLKRNHMSLPRNPDIAHICFLRGYIDKIGRGTLKIIEDCKQFGLQEPKWISRTGVTTLTFFNKRHEVGEIIINRLNNRQLNLLTSLKVGEEISFKDYFRGISNDVSERTARFDLSALVNAGWLKKIGETTRTRFIRTEKHI
jgi:ATP-dependent DNA helicase RecG